MQEDASNEETQATQSQEVAPEQEKTDVAPVPSMEQLSEALSKMPEHELEKLPQVLQFKTRFMTQKDKEYKDRESKQRSEFAKQQQDRAKAEQIMTWARTNPQEAGQAVLTNPEVRRQIDWAEEQMRTIPGTGETREQVLQGFATGLADHLNELHPDSGIDAHSFPDMKGALTAFRDWSVEKKMEEERKELREELAAYKAEVDARLQRVAPQPEKGASGTAPGGKRVFRASEIEKMSLADYNKLEAEINEAVSEGRVTED